MKPIPHPHPPVRVLVAEGGVVVEVDGYELFDWVDDHLTEQCSLISEYHLPPKNAGEPWRLYFNPEVEAQEMVERLLELDASEVERVHALSRFEK